MRPAISSMTSVQALAMKTSAQDCHMTRHTSTGGWANLLVLWVAPPTSSSEAQAWRVLPLPISSPYGKASRMW